MLDFLKNAQIPPDKIKIHAFTDGRDSPPTSGKIYMPQLVKKLQEEKLGTIVSISGRYYAMDRDNRWDRTQKAYLAITGSGEKKSVSPQEVIEQSYLEGITDEFIEPTMITDENSQPLGAVKEGDCVIFFNFRPDRARQLTKAFVQSEFKNTKTTSGEVVPTFQRGPKINNLFFVTLTEYEKDLPVSAVCYRPQQIFMPIARVISERNLQQLHIAETEKYAHVTYFFNGGREAPFSGEDRILVDSQKVSSYDKLPQMSAGEITKRLISKINLRVYDFIIVNFANADMVAHTGKFEPTIEAVKSVDYFLGIIAHNVLSVGGGIIITADHGNAEELINLRTGEVDTEHNVNPAPCIFVLKELRGLNAQLPQGILADVAPSILSILKIPRPSQMTGTSLL